MSVVNFLICTLSDPSFIQTENQDAFLLTYRHFVTSPTLSLPTLWMEEFKACCSRQREEQQLRPVKQTGPQKYVAILPPPPANQFCFLEFKKQRRKGMMATLRILTVFTQDGGVPACVADCLCSRLYLKELQRHHRIVDGTT